MDDAKLRDTTANAVSWLHRETKQQGLFNPPQPRSSPPHPENLLCRLIPHFTDVIAKHLFKWQHRLHTIQETHKHTF